MDVKTLKQTTAAFTAGLITTALLSCGENGGSADTSTTAPSTSEVEKASGSLGDVATKAKETAGDALASFKKEYTAQLDQHQDKVDALKASAASLGDRHVNSILTQLDQKIAAAREELAKIINAEEGSVEALKAKIQPLLDEITNMYNHAKSHM